MKFKKIYSLLLLFTISFSVMHDYTFALLDDNSPSVESYMNDLSAKGQKRVDVLCDIHFEYHMPYTFPAKTPSIPLLKKADDLFIYKDLPVSLKEFNFLKPPIA